MVGEHGLTADSYRVQYLGLCGNYAPKKGSRERKVQKTVRVYNMMLLEMLHALQNGANNVAKLQLMRLSSSDAARVTSST